MEKIKKSSLLLLLVFVFFLTGCFSKKKKTTENTTTKIVPKQEELSFDKGTKQLVPKKNYIGKNDDNYMISNFTETESFYGDIDSIGDLYIEGEISEKQMNGYPSYGLKGSSVRFMYCPKDVKTDEFKIVEESKNSINGTKIGKIGYGAMIIFKSFDTGSSWNYTGLSFVDITKEITFTPTGEDIQSGCLYKFVFVAKCKQFLRTDTKQIIIWEFEDDKYENIEVAQVYYCYVAEDSLKVGFYAGVYETTTKIVDSRVYNSSGDSIAVDIDNLKREKEIPVSSLGELSISGQISNDGETSYLYNGTKKVTFNYKKTFSLPDTWDIQNSPATSLFGYDIGTIGNGLVLILKKNDNDSEWIKIGCQSLTYTDDFSFDAQMEDVFSGCSYRFITCYEFGEIIGTKSSGALWWKKKNNVYNNYYVYQINDLHIKSMTGDEVSEKFDATAKFLFKIGSSLVDGSMSFSTIGIDMYGRKDITVSALYNGKESYILNDGEVLKKAGKYDITIENSFGEKTNLTLYIVDLGNDKGYYQAFGDNFISQDYRVYEEDINNSYYCVGTTLNVRSNNLIPGVMGKIYKIDGDGKVLIDDIQLTKYGYSLILTEPGKYYADMFLGDPYISGQSIEYQFNFYVVESGKPPYVNEKLFSSPNREYAHYSYMRKVYTVKVPSKGQGSFIFVFPYDYKYEALEFAEMIELNNVITGKDGYEEYYIYKGVRYESKIDLYNELYNNVIEMVKEEIVSKIELNAEKYTIDSYLYKDVYVCSTEEMRDHLMTSDIILNDFIFYQVAGFESSKVSLFDENGKEYRIGFWKNISEVLTKTGTYRIEESNWAGKTTYYGNYIAEGDNTGIIDVRWLSDKKVYETDISQNNYAKIKSPMVVLENGHDKYDSQNVINIYLDDVLVDKMLLKDLKNYCLTSPGKYKIEVSNRLDYSYSFNIEVNNKSTKGFTYASLLEYEEENIIKDVEHFSEESKDEDNNGKKKGLKWWQIVLIVFGAIIALFVIFIVIAAIAGV